MKLAKVDLKALRNEVTRLATENPEHVYEKQPYGDGHFGCLYVIERGGEKVGSCIMGQALINLGVDPRELARYEHKGIDELLVQVKPGTRYSQVAWFDEVQSSQDAGFSWKVAVERADGVKQVELANIHVQEYLA